MNPPKPNKTAWTKRGSLAVNKPGQGAFTFIELLVAYLDGASEKPNAVTTTGSGMASFALEGNTLWYYVSFESGSERRQ